MPDIQRDSQQVVKSILQHKTDSIKYQPVKEAMREIVDSRLTLSSDEEEYDRKKYRREQPLIDHNISQRSQQDKAQTETAEVLLSKATNKMELALNPVLNAEIYKSLEREEFVYLPSYELSKTDQKLLFDLGVQLQFAKKSSLLNLLRSDMPHYTRDYPIESLFEQDKIVEQLILFGNSNDTELKRAIVPIYEILFEKMQQVLEARLNPVLKKATESDPARRHLVSGADQEYLQISYPSLDESQYTQAVFQTRTEQTSMKTYSFITVLDALIKNCFNLCTEDVLVSKFANMMGNFIVPLLQRLHRINPTRVRKMVFGYLALFRRLVAQTNLSDPKQTLFLVPALKVSILLLRVLDVSSIKQEEYLANRGYFLFLFDCYVHLLLLRADFQDCWELMTNFDSQHSVLVTEIDNILLSLEYLRELEVKVVKGDQSGSYLSDKLEEFKKVYKKLQKASSALYFSQKAQGVIDLYIQNHLRAVLLQSNPESIDPEFNHYSGSVTLLTKMLSLEVEEITLQIIRSLNMSLFSTDTLGFPGISGMTKELTYRALCDKRLATVLFSSGLLSKSIVIADAAFELLHNFVKKAFEKKEIDNTPARLLIPIIMPTTASQNRSRSLLELLASKDPKFLLYQACSELFSKDKRTRSDAYAKMFQEEFFDTCLAFAPTTTATQKRVIQNSKQPPKPVRVQFTDPLHGIVDTEGRLVYYGRLTDFRSKEAKLGRITQAQIRSLQELLQLAVNEHLDFNVRGVAIDQITEAIYFYRDSAALEDLAGTLLDLCVENITSFGNCRENFTMLVENLRNHEEDLSLRVTPEDLPLQNKQYPEERLLASKYLNLFNVLIKDYRGLREARHEVLEEIFTSTQRKGFARALWLFATERDLDYRYPSMITLSMVFLGNPSLHENLVGYKPGQSGQETIQQVEMDKGGKSKPEPVKKTGPASQIQVLSVFDETYYMILDSASRYNHVSEEHPLQRCEPAKKEQIIRYIQAFISESTGAEGSYLSFDPKVNKNKLEQLLVDKMLTKGLKLYTSALKKERGLEHIEVWTNGALVCTFIGRTDFWEETELYAGYFEELRIKLNQGKDQDYVQAVATLTNLIKCEEFRLGYVASSVQQAFVHALTIQLHEKILPNLYEYHVERFAEKHEIIVKTFQLMSSILQVGLESNDQKLVVLTRGFITRNNFMEFLADVFRRFESMDILSSALIEFLRVHFDLFMKKGSDAKFVSILTLIYDSALICTRTDNFFGIERLRNVLRLTHALCSKNQFISLGVKKPLYEDMKEMSTREETRMPTAFKTSTIAWIFSLLDHRCIDVRISCWNIVCNYLDASLLELFPSQLESCIATCSLVNEATGVLIQCYTFLTKCAKLLQTVEYVSLMSRDSVDRKLDKHLFARIFHDRKGMDTIRKTLANKQSPDGLIAAICRFLIEFYKIDPNSIVNKYFHTDFMEKLMIHLQITRSEAEENFEIQSLRGAVDRTYKAVTTIHFLRQTSIGMPANSKALLKNFSILPILQLWIDFASSLLRQGLVFEGSSKNTRHPSAKCGNTQLFSFMIDKAAKELAWNALAFVEVLHAESEDTLVHFLNGIPANQKSLFHSLADLLIYDAQDSNLGYAVLKLVAKLLLSWPEGFTIIDSDESSSSIADNLMNRVLSFFKTIDYSKISDKDYINIIHFEELIHILGVFVSKSQLMKDRLLTSGLFGLYVSKFVQIINSFNKDVSFVTTPAEKKEQNDKAHLSKPLGGSSTRIGSGLNTSKLASSNLHPAVRRPGTSANSSGIVATSGHASNTQKLQANIRSITQNSAGHIKAYTLIAKYMFHTQHQQTRGREDPLAGTLKKQQANQQQLSAALPSLISVLSFLWTEGQSDEEVLTDLLELLINWHLHPDHGPVLFGRLVDNKYTLLADVLKILAKLEVGRECREMFLKFVTCIMGSNQVRTIIYRSKILQSYSELFVKRKCSVTAVYDGTKEFNWKNEKLQAIIRFWLPLSFHADSHSHIMTCKEVADGLTLLLLECKSQVWLEDLLLLLANLAYSKVHKVRFDENKELLTENLRLLGDESQSIKARAICSQFFLNVTHKCTKTISVLNKKAVLEELRLMIDESERAVDKLTFDETISCNPEEKSSRVHLLRTLVSNLRRLASMIAVNCGSGSSGGSANIKKGSPISPALGSFPFGHNNTTLV